MAELRVMPKPLVRQPDRIDNLEYLRDFGRTVESTREDVAILNGVRGFAAAYMTKNVNIEWSFGSNVRKLPFGAPFGVEPKGRTWTRRAHRVRRGRLVVVHRHHTGTVNELQRQRRCGAVPVSPPTGRLGLRRTAGRQAARQRQRIADPHRPIPCARTGLPTTRPCVVREMRWFDGGTRYSGSLPSNMTTD